MTSPIKTDGDISVNRKNLTWDFKDWRLYIIWVEPKQLWFWNIKDHEWGWEYSEFSHNDRETALIEALHTIEAIEHDQFKIAYPFEYNGITMHVELSPKTSVADFIERITARSDDFLRYQLIAHDRINISEPEHLDRPIQLYYNAMIPFKYVKKSQVKEVVSNVSR